MKFRTLPEAINYILTGVIETAPAAILTETFEDRVARARKVIADDTTFLEFIRMASDPEYQLSGLKEGMPKKIKLERTIPAGISDSTARQEFRRIKGFLPNGSYATLAPIKREEIWTTLLEGLHWSEALTLTQIKDQTLFTEYPDLENVLKVAQGKEVLEVTTVAPKELVKEVLKMKIDIDTGVATNKAAKAGVEAFDNRPPALNNPAWTPAATNGTPLLEITLTTKAPETTEAPKKKRKSRAKKSQFESTPDAATKTPDAATKTPTPIEEGTLTEAEYNEMVKLSDDLREERNIKMNALNTQEEIMGFMKDWETYSAEKLKTLRDKLILKRTEN